MLFLPRQQLDTVEHLRTALGNAIALELATIPPYLTALFSIKAGTNAAPAAIIRSVVIEEMLHLSLACNMLNAVRGRPRLPEATLRYPSELPMGIGDKPGKGGKPDKKFIVPLERLSMPAVKRFMTIEEPEEELKFEKAQRTAQARDYHTIGEFYRAVGTLMEQLGERVFTGDRKRQVTGWIGTNFVHPIHKVDDALKAIELIVEQGEGTANSPGDSEELAHFYRFEQIKRHETLNPNPGKPHGYAWGGPVIRLDEDGVWPMTKNPPRVKLPEGSPVARMSDRFDATFSALIDELQRTFDGSPQAFGSSVAQMHALRLEAQELVSMEIPGQDGKTAGPRFLYVGS
jgi:hypothetical protein